MDAIEQATQSTRARRRRFLGTAFAGVLPARRLRSLASWGAALTVGAVLGSLILVAMGIDSLFAGLR